MNRDKFIEKIDYYLNYINEEIKKGNSVNKIAKGLGLREDNIRKWMKFAGFEREKESKLFVKVRKTQDVKESIQKNTNNKSNNQKSIQNITTKVINKYPNVYHIENTQEQEDFHMEYNVKGIKLKDFRNMSTIEQIELVNSFTDGKKTLEMITKQHFAFNVGLFFNAYYDKSEIRYDKTEKKYIVVDINVLKDELESLINTTEKEILSSLSKINDLDGLVKFANKIQRAEELIENYEINKTETEVISVRTYKNTKKVFDDYLDTLGISKQEGYTQALLSFIDKSDELVKEPMC